MSRNKVRKQQAVDRHNAQYEMHRQLEELNAKNSFLFEGRTPGKSKPVGEMLRGQTPHVLTYEDMGGIKPDDGGLRRDEFAVVSANTPSDKSIAGHEPHDYQQPLINALKEEPGYAPAGYVSVPLTDMPGRGLTEGSLLVPADAFVDKA